MKKYISSHSQPLSNPNKLSKQDMSGRPPSNHKSRSEGTALNKEGHRHSTQTFSRSQQLNSENIISDTSRRKYKSKSQRAKTVNIRPESPATALRKSTLAKFGMELSISDSSIDTVSIQEEVTVKPSHHLNQRGCKINVIL